MVALQSPEVRDICAHLTPTECARLIEDARGHALAKVSFRCLNSTDLTRRDLFEEKGSNSVGNIHLYRCVYNGTDIDNENVNNVCKAVRVSLATQFPL